jgi:putative transposase
VLHLYLPPDVLSRKMVGWEVYASESARQAAEVFAKARRREGLAGKPLVLHSDNGSRIKGATMLAPLHRLGVMRFTRRPKPAIPGAGQDPPMAGTLGKSAI